MTHGDGTLLRLKCDCCGRETMAKGDLFEGRLVITDRRHGTDHHVTMNIIDIVTLLDPQGTTVVVLGR